MRKSPLLLVAALFASNLACEDPREGQAEKRKECNRFILAINDNATAMRKHTGKSEVADPSEHDAAAASRLELAKLYDRVSSTVGAFELNDPQLVIYAGEYKKVARDAAAQARRAGTALKKDDVEKANAAQKEFNAAVKKENQLLLAITGYCRVL